MRRKVIKLYKFDELSKKAQQRVIEDNRDYHTRDMDWRDSCYEDAERAGLKITSFDCYRRTIDGDLQMTAMESVKAILKDHGDSCDTYKLAKVYEPIFATDLLNCRVMDDEESYPEEDPGHVEQYKKELLHLYLEMLDREYEYLERDECLQEHFEGGDEEFLASGEMA